jgi:hypothetical protein
MYCRVVGHKPNHPVNKLLRASFYVLCSVYIQTVKASLPQKTTAAKPLLSFQFEPVPKLDRGDVIPTFQPSKPEDPRLESYMSLVKPVREAVKAAGWDHEKSKRKGLVDGSKSGSEDEGKGWDVEDGDVIVVPLGTGAAIPGKYRNGKCHLLEFDCFDGVSFPLF